MMMQTIATTADVGQLALKPWIKQSKSVLFILQYCHLVLDLTLFLAALIDSVWQGYTTRRGWGLCG
jgi:hypothetical protein